MRTKYNAKAVAYLMNEFKNQFVIDNENSKIAMLEYVKSRPTYLEIGPGKGQFILQIAKEHPEYNFLVCELNPTICGIALKKIDESELTNVKLFYGNFYKLRDILQSDAFEGLFLNFSDPWPKKRHIKRRLTHDLFLVEYAKIIKEGGMIRFKSDNQELYEYSLEQFEKNKWEVLENNTNYTSYDSFDALTEYETRYKNQGINIKRVVLKKTKDTMKEVVEEE